MKILQRNDRLLRTERSFILASIRANGIIISKHPTLLRPRHILPTVQTQVTTITPAMDMVGQLRILMTTSTQINLHSGASMSLSPHLSRRCSVRLKRISSPFNKVVSNIPKSNKENKNLLQLERGNRAEGQRRAILSRSITFDAPISSFICSVDHSHQSLSTPHNIEIILPIITILIVAFRCSIHGDERANIQATFTEVFLVLMTFTPLTYLGHS